ncbi:MAG: methionyl-tRNA formyltransferase [Eubacterium sp.]|nr:methionyl-tRNA formyltransferase [Eubacterium sp.]
MRIVFMGTPDFAVPCLDALISAGHEVVGVFSQPDKPVGRKQFLMPPAVKVEAQKFNIPVYQPERLKDFNADEIIKKLRADLTVIVAYGKILPKAVLDSAPYGCINVHASLLPKYRGAAPIQWAILNGDKETGVTVMQMDEGLDTGDMLLVKKTVIDPDETSDELFVRLSVLGAEALIETLEELENGTIKRTPQPVGDFGYAKMITKELCPIDWNKPASVIHNQVRGLQSWPCALTRINGKTVKIHKTKLCDGISASAGEVVESDFKLIVSCGDGKCLEVLMLQPEGKKAMEAKAYLAGNRIEKGTILGD